MKPLASLVVLFSLACICDAQGPDPIAPNKGAYSVGFSADWARAQDGSSVTDFSVNLAYFVADSIELRVPLGFEDLVGSRETIYGIGARWHFMKSGTKKNSAFDPFLGAEDAHASATMGFREDLVE